MHTVSQRHSRSTHHTHRAVSPSCRAGGDGGGDSCLSVNNTTTTREISKAKITQQNTSIRLEQSLIFIFTLRSASLTDSGGRHTHDSFPPRATSPRNAYAAALFFLSHAICYAFEPHLQALGQPTNSVLSRKFSQSRGKLAMEQIYTRPSRSLASLCILESLLL